MGGNDKIGIGCGSSGLLCRDKSDGGHAFVCDGYEENGLFHINWVGVRCLMDILVYLR
jgi:hypothetical protein